MLLEIIERRSLVTNRKSIVHRFKCDACEAIIEGSKTRDRGVMHFCDNKCRGKYKHDHPETWQKSIQALNSPASHAKAKATIQEKAARGEWRPWLGKSHTEETKRHLSEVSKGEKRSGTNNGMYGRKHSEETRAKMSEKKAQAITEGRFRSYGTQNKKGTYVSVKNTKEHFFKSSWEEAAMKFLDASPTVEGWEYESLKIPYYYNNNKRWHVPDFIVYFTDGSKEIWEVKPEEFLLTERVMNTAAAGREYSRANGFNDYRHITRQVMRDLGIVV